MSQESPQRSPQPRRRRSGAALDRDDAGREAAARVGPQDADAVAAFWDKHAPKPARTLLDSEEAEPDG